MKLSPNNVRATDEMCQYGSLESSACAAMKDSLISSMIASICTSDITHACVVFSGALTTTTTTKTTATTTTTTLGCVPLDLNNKNGDIPMLNVTLKEHGVHWLQVVPMYRNQDCKKYQHQHVANMPQLRVVSVSCKCPFLSTFLYPARGAWESLGSRETSRYEVNVLTKKMISDDTTCKSEVGKTSSSLQQGRVCLRALLPTQTDPTCAEAKETILFDLGLTPPTSMNLEVWWEGEHKECINVTVGQNVQISTEKKIVAAAAPSSLDHDHDRDRDRDDDGELVILTGLDDQYINFLEQLVGSIALWEPVVKIEVVNLGLSSESIEKIQQWRVTMDISVVPFDFERYPPHVKDLMTYAFKSLAIQEGLMRHANILWIDAGMVLWGRLDRARHAITSSIGAFFVTDGQPMKSFPWGDANFHHPGTMEKLNVTNDINASQTQCIGGLQGWSIHGSFFKEALPLLVNCALDVECITPMGSSRLNHLQDQTVLNAVFSKLHIDPCRKNKVFESLSWDVTPRTHGNKMFRRMYEPASEAYEVFL